LFGGSVIVRIFIKKSLDFNQKAPQKETSKSERWECAEPTKSLEKIFGFASPLSNEFMSTIKMEKKNITIQQLEQLAQALGVNPSDLLKK